MGRVAVQDILDDREPAMDESEDEQKASEPTKRPIANSDEGQSVNGNKRRKQEDDNDFEVGACRCTRDWYGTRSNAREGVWGLLEAQVL